MRSLVTITTIALIAVAALAGCSAKTSGTPQSTDSPASTTATDESNGAPKVAHPLDTAKFQADPCSVVTQDQLRSLGMDQTGSAKPGNPAGPLCTFNDFAHSANGLGFGVTFVTLNKKGLASIYGQKDTLAVFDPLPLIQGYPAIDYSPVDLRNRGSVGVAVGVTDQLTFEVDVDISTGAPNRTNPTPIAVKIADMVLTNLKKGA